ESAKTITETPKPASPPEIELKSAKGIDYRKLEDLLKRQQWKQADEETTNVMLQAANRTSEGWLREENIDNFPCEDLRTIDQLWVKYSGGRFGFSVQAKIYRELGGTRQYNERVWNALGDRVGWRVNKSWIYYKDVTFDLKAPLGHLPGGSSGGGVDYSLLSRRDL
ncbi:MAG: GUN4 domain-containing protein, partial [Microcystis sp. M015S2]|uniref:GUN4 domain-containing protein n=2 Tax=Microcystis TaxID=1125 RepID=UPI0025847CB9